MNHKRELPANIRIRPERVEEHGAIREIVRAAFGQEDEAVLVDALRRESEYVPGLSLVAQSGDHIVGQILFTRLHIGPDEPPPFLALAPIAVRPDCQKRGIGSALVRNGIELSRRLGFRGIVVVGHPEYYPKFGFLPARSFGLECPFPVPDEAFLALELVPGSFPTGGIRYARPFYQMG
jgi:putative acetyltransferase